MTGYRTQTGGLINRKKTVSFRFNGRRVSGFEGDTFASALLASGQQMVGRSFKYHRPRGVMSTGVEEGGALFNLGDGAERVPNVKGTVAEIAPDINVTSQNVWPSLHYDIGAVNGLISPFITAGFYYKTFMGPFANTRFWMMCEHFIRKAAGLGEASRLADPDAYDIANHHCDVLVVGSGPSGLIAAAELAEAGFAVMLVEQDFIFGGEWANKPDDNRLAQIKTLCRRIEMAGGVMMRRATAFGLYDGLVTGVLERQTDHLGSNRSGRARFRPRETMHIIRPKQIVMATGAIERGLAFGNNDRPGVMLGGALQTYLDRYGVVCGNSVVMATTHDGAYQNAIALAQAGLEVSVIDARARLTAAARQALNAGASVQLETVPLNAIGDKAVAAVEIGRIDASGNITRLHRQIGCNVLGVSGGYAPVVNLLSHRGVKPVWNTGINSFLSGKTKEQIYHIGAADGLFSDDAVIVSAHNIVARIRGVERPYKSQRKGWASAQLPLFEIRPEGVSLKSFADPQHDVTTDDIRQAKDEGFVSVEHLKRYTTLGMATDQGRMGNVIGLGVLAEALEKDIAETGITTFRPPFTPVSIGALAGRLRGEEWVATRRTPMHHLHLKAGAEMTDAGIWKRPWFYPEAGETINEAYIREAARARQTVAMVDVSTLGKIMIQGPDATEFLNRIYVNPFAKLPVGKARYGLMLRDDGMVLDDGTTWRLAEDEYLMTTTTAQAGPVMQFLEELLQTRWQEMRVHVTSVTDLWAGMAITGPQARQLLGSIITDIDFSQKAFPFMGVRSGHISIGRKKIACHAARISFSGEMAWEIYVNADDAEQAWLHMAEQVKQAGGCLYGLEALGALRIEKGHVTGAELDGRVTLEDAGFGAFGAKKPHYVGSVLRKRPALQDSNRPTLVGIYPKDKQTRFSAGGILCQPEHVKGFGEGWVTAVTHSPALGHWIGLGFISGGYEKWKDRTVIVADPVRDSFVEAEIVSPHMYDPSGDRQNG